MNDIFRKKKFGFCFVIASLFLGMNLFSQTKNISEIKFSSPYEREAFKSVGKPISFLKLLLAMSSTMTLDQETQIKNDLNSFIEELRVKVEKERSDKKRIDYIQQKTHQHFLTKYVEISPFHNIFKNGEYNCVSSTALFAYILQGLDIPFEVKQKPTHVYLVAYPESSIILLESTLPINGIFQLNEKQKNGLIRYLVSSNIIDESELETTDENAIIFKYFYTDENVKPEVLVSFQYYNNAISLYNNELTLKAYESICKAELIYTCKAFDFLKHEIVQNIAKDASFEDISEVRYLKDMAKFSSSATNLLYYFEKALDEQLIKKNNVSLADSVMNYFKSDLTDSSLIKEATLTYHYSLASYYLITSSNKNALSSILKAYELDKNDLKIQNLMVSAFINMDEFTDEDEDLISKLEKQAADYPFLKNNNKYMSFQLTVISIVIFYEYEDFEFEEGIALLPKVVELLNKIQDFSAFKEELVAHVFGDAGAFYYRKKDYKKAMELLNLGYKYFPEDENINAKIEIVKNAMSKTTKN
jgi:hypothetical protein